MSIPGEHWMRYRIVVHSFTKLDSPDDQGHVLKVNNYNLHILKTFDYPHRITKKWAWYINYWFAKLQMRFPQHKLSLHVCGYCPDAEADVDERLKRSISAARAQVTKVLNVMEMRRKEMSTQLYQDEETDPVMIMGRRKLHEKQFKLSQLIIN